MATLKVMSFDRTRIRTYLEGTEALKQGIRFVKCAEKSITDDTIAKEAAILLAEDRCVLIWQRDSTGYIDSEYKAFKQLEKDINNKFFFYCDEMRKEDDAVAEAKKKEEEKNEKEKNEKKRVAELQKRCEIKGLNFEEENLKQLKQWRNNISLSRFLKIFSIVGAIVLELLYTLNIITLSVGAPCLCICGVLLIYSFFIVPPSLPDGTYDVLEKGEKRR